MVIRINLSKFSRRKKAPPGGTMIDFSKEPAIKDPPQPARAAGPTRPSQLIDHGKAPHNTDSVSPLPSTGHRRSTLIDHGKAPRSENSRSPLLSAESKPSKLIDLGKIA